MRWQEQRGSSEPIAFLGLMPLLLFVILAVLQLTLFGYTLVVMESAARDGARAASAGDDAVKAIEEVVHGTGVPMRVSVACPPGSPRVTVDVTAYVPKIMPGMSRTLLTLNRAVTIPREENCPT